MKGGARPLMVYVPAITIQPPVSPAGLTRGSIFFA
jgi:hypothetical protein